jgi:hypothetical protein
VKRLWLPVLFLLLLLVPTSSWVVMTQWVLPPRLFREAVLNTIPPSVKRIRGRDGHRAQVLRFNISEEDVARILASDDFRQIEYVDYSRGILRYAERHFQGESYVRHRSDGAISEVHEASDGMGGSFMPFGESLAPRWFQFARWRAFKVYAVERSDEIHEFHEVRLLIHNPDAGQAYFINYEVRGTW